MKSYPNKQCHTKNPYDNIPHCASLQVKSYWPTDRAKVGVLSYGLHLYQHMNRDVGNLFERLIVSNLFFMKFSCL